MFGKFDEQARERRVFFWFGVVALVAAAVTALNKAWWATACLGLLGMWMALSSLLLDRSGFKAFVWVLEFLGGLGGF